MSGIVTVNTDYLNDVLNRAKVTRRQASGELGRSEWKRRSTRLRRSWEYIMGEDRKRINSVTREALTILYAAGQAIDTVAPKLEQLVRRTQNGWRDLRMVQSKTDKLIESVLNTIPVEQLDTMIAQMRISHLRIVTNDVGKSDESK